jgi:hypothetical protein
MALGLARFGVGGGTAAAAALFFHALEPCAAALFGLCGLAVVRLAAGARMRIPTRPQAARSPGLARTSW